MTTRHRTEPIPEQLTDLTPRQLAALEEVKEARRNRDAGIESYGRAIEFAHDNGISYGVMGYVLGLPREAVYRSRLRYEYGKDWRKKVKRREE